MRVTLPLLPVPRAPVEKEPLLDLRPVVLPSLVVVPSWRVLPDAVLPLVTRVEPLVRRLLVLLPWPSVTWRQLLEPVPLVWVQDRLPPQPVLRLRPPFPSRVR